eukprot:8343108-Pyramimonas_sp.AAC.1
MATQFKRLEEALVVANSQSTRPAQIQSSQFDRDTDGTSIRVSAGQLVSKDAVLAGLAPCLSEVGFDNDKYELQSADPLAKKFILKFTGAAGLAARR